MNGLLPGRMAGLYVVTLLVFIFKIIKSNTKQKVSPFWNIRHGMKADAMLIFTFPLAQPFPILQWIENTCLRHIQKLGLST